MITSERLRLVKVMVSQLDVYQIILSKQQKLDADPKAIQHINFTGNLDRAEGSTMFFTIEEVKEAVLDFQKKQLKYYDFIWFLILI